MKKNLTLTKLMLVVLMAILPLSFYAQKTQSKPVERYFYLMAEGGLAFNHTDIANYGFIPFYQDMNHDGTNEFVFNDGYVFKNLNGKVGLGYQFGKVMGINAKFGTARLSGEKMNKGWFDRMVLIDDAAATPYNYLQMNESKFMEANLNLTFNFSNLFFGYNPRRVFNFIPHAGVGGIRYHAGEINDLASGTPVQIAPAKTDAEMALTVPVGAELNFNVARMLDIYLDYTYTFMALKAGDGLDQVNKFKELNNQVNSDMYSSLNLGLRLKFNKKPCDIDKMARESKDIKMTVAPQPLEEKDGKVCFTVTYEIPAEYFEKEAVMNLTPTMSYKGGKVTLDPVTFVGEKVKESGDFRVPYKTGGTYTKDYCMDYVPGMEDGVLSATPMFYVYDGKIYPTQDDIVKNTFFAQGSDRVIAKGVNVPVVICEVSDLNTKVEENNLTVSWTGDAETYDIFMAQEGIPDENTAATVAGIKTTSYTFTDLEPGEYHVFVKANCKNKHGSWQEAPEGVWQKAPVVEITPVKTLVCTFFFDYNSSELRSSTKLNKQAAKALASRLSSGEPFTDIIIEGWASPEGELALNNNLADDRAKAAETALKNQMKKVKVDAKNFNFNVKGFGPDWNKFIELVKNSNIKDKDQIVNVIQSSKNREKEIKNLINVYPELEKDILPLIRRAEVYVK